MSGSIPIVSVSPEKAHYWLTNCNYNRQRIPRQQAILEMALAYEDGSLLAHNPIILTSFNNQVYLVDGQHRLQAILLYGRAIDSPLLEICVSSIDEVNRMYGRIDQDTKRSMLDVIRAERMNETIGLNERQTAHFSATVKLIPSGFDDTGRTFVRRANYIIGDLMTEWMQEALAYFGFIHGGISGRGCPALCCKRTGAAG